MCYIQDVLHCQFVYSLPYILSDIVTRDQLFMMRNKEQFSVQTTSHP